MSAFELQPVVGLFGTCGDSTFRKDLFIPTYEERGIDYYNPQVDDWKPEYALEETDHLTHDVIQCWPVLSSTYGSSSLTEQGYSIAASMRAATPLQKSIIAMIEMGLSDTLTDEVARKESLRARIHGSTHMGESESPSLYIVSSLEEMLEASIGLYGAAKTFVENARSYNPAYKRFVEGRKQGEAFAAAMASGKLGKVAVALVDRQQS